MMSKVLACPTFHMFMINQKEFGISTENALNTSLSIVRVRESGKEGS